MRSALTARPNPTWATSVTWTGSATTASCGCGPARSPWPGSTPAWCAAATPCRAGPTAAGSATGRSPGSAPARPRPLLAAAVSAALKAAEAGLAFGPSRALLGPAAARTGPGPRREDPPHGLFPHPDPYPDLGRGAVPGHGRGPGRPGICRHLGDARRNRAVPRAGPGPAARPRRRPDTSHRDGRRAHRPCPGQHGHTLTTRQTTQLPGSSGPLARHTLEE